MIQISVSHYMPRAHATHCDFIAPWAAALVEAAGGAVSVTIHDGDTPLGLLDRQYAQAVDGTIDVAHSVGSLPRGHFQRLAVVGAPFLVDSALSGARLLWRLLPDHLAPEFAGLKVLALHADAGGYLHTRDRAITRAEDLAGLRIRSPNPLVGATLRALGAEPIELTAPQIRPALADRRIDGAAMAWDVMDYTGARETLRFHLDDRLYVSPLYFVMNANRHAGLPPAVQTAVERVSGAQLGERLGRLWPQWERPGRDGLPGDHVVTRLAPVERGRWRQAAEAATRATLCAQEASGARGVVRAYEAALAHRETDST